MLLLSEKRSRILLISCLIIAVTLSHFGTPNTLMYLHVLLRELYFIPVFLAGLWFGKKGGLIAATVTVAIYLHHALTVMMPTSEMAVSTGIEILLLFVAGLLSGTYADIKRGYLETIHGPKAHTVVSSPAEQRLLVYVDDSGAAMNVIRYVADMFGQVPDVRVTLLSVLREPNADLPSPNEQESPKNPESKNLVLEKAREILIKSGFADDFVESRLVRRYNVRASDALLRQQKAGAYTAIVLGRRPLSRAEEFLFGDTAIRLVRSATCPVWVVADDSDPQNSSEETATALEDSSSASHSENPLLATR